MLLGQIVAISFAQSLFFVAVTLYGPDDTVTDRNKSERARHRRGLPTMVYVACRKTIWALAIFTPIKLSEAIHKPRFLYWLAIPHVALMLPPMLDPILAPQHPDERDEAILRNERSSTYNFTAVFGITLQIIKAVSALQDKSLGTHLHRHSEVYSHPLLDPTSDSHPWGLIGSLYDHPAVTSVGWDVILCSAIYGIWRLVRHSR